MNHVYDTILAVHIVAALNALPSFWIGLCLRKGSSHHRWFGRLFARSMIAMTLSGGLLAGALAWDPMRFAPPSADVVDVAGYCAAVRQIASTLVFAALFMLWLVVFGMRALRRSRRSRGTDLAIAAGLVLLGAAALPFGRLPGWEVLDGGGIALLVSGALHWIRSRRRAPASRIVDHVAGMLGAGTTLHAALVVQVLPRFVPGFEGERMFDAGEPVLLTGVLLTAATCLYARRRFGRGRAGGPREGLEILAELAADSL